MKIHTELLYTPKLLHGGLIIIYETTLIIFINYSPYFTQISFMLM
jgi:hypothetical protein